jgi:hypothetical protein
MERVTGVSGQNTAAAHKRVTGFCAHSCSANVDTNQLRLNAFVKH